MKGGAGAPNFAIALETTYLFDRFVDRFSYFEDNLMVFVHIRGL